MIHISLISDFFQLICSSSGTVSSRRRLAGCLRGIKGDFKQKFFGHTLLFHLVSFCVFSFVQPDDIIVLGDADLFVVMSIS